MSALDHDKMKAMLEEAGFKDVRVEASAVTGSPHDWVYVYLTPQEHEGDHLIVSPGSEYGETGILVGKHEHFEEAPKTPVRRVFTMEEALNRCNKYVRD